MANYSHILKKARRAGLKVIDYPHYSVIQDVVTGESVGVSYRTNRSHHSDRRAMSLVRRSEKRAI